MIFAFVPSTIAFPDLDSFRSDHGNNKLHSIFSIFLEENKI